jgi:hypothetical protein
MANIRPTTTSRNAMLQAILDRINLGSGPGTIKIYDGAQPANGDTAPSGTLLATLAFSDPASGAPASGSVTFSAIAEVNAAATGTATWARIADSTAASVFDGDVKSDGTGFINFNRTDFVAGGPVRITSFVLTVPASITF